MCKICCDFVSSFLKMIMFAVGKDENIGGQIKKLADSQVDTQKVVKSVVKRPRKKTEK